MKTQAIKESQLHAVATAVGLLAGTLMITQLRGPIGWLGGTLVCAAAEVHRRRERLAPTELITHSGRWLWGNATEAVTSFHDQARDTLEVYDNVSQRFESFLDTGTQYPMLDVGGWVASRRDFRSLMIAGIPGEGKTHLFKAFCNTILETYDKRYLKICTTDKGLSHDDDDVETFLDLPDHFFATDVESILGEIQAAYNEVENRYQASDRGDAIEKYPYFLFIDELLYILLLAQLSKEQAADLNLWLTRILVGGPKARVWIIGATQQLDCGSTGLKQATFKLFEFIMLPIMGSETDNWRNFQKSVDTTLIDVLKAAPAKAPKPIGVRRAGKTQILMLPKIDLPDSVSVIQPENEAIKWAESWSTFIDKCLEENPKVGMRSVWESITETDQTAPKRRSDDNAHWLAFKAEFARRREAYQ